MIFKDLITPVYEDTKGDDYYFRLLSGYGQFSSLACACLLTLDRAIAVIYPFKYRLWRTKRTVMTALFICWLASIVLQLIYFFTYRCRTKLPEKYCYRIIIIICLLAIVAFMVVANISVFNSFRRRTEVFSENTAAASNLSRRLLERRVVYVAFLSTNCVVLFTTPYAVVTLLKCFKVEVQIDVLLVVFLLFMMKSVINPLIFFAGRYSIRADNRRISGSS